MESMPCFNAGTGGALNEHGELELDASVMRGRDLRGGAIGALPPFPHPIEIARAVMEEGTHVFYAGEGAAAFAESRGFERAAAGAMITEGAKERLSRVLAGREGVGWAGGTVGAVVRDREGRMAAATSTGGTVGKRRGRIGDTPVLGAGTWADDETGACSATGIGEQILRYNLARAACEQLRAGLSAQEAADRAIAGFFSRVEGSGGVILLAPEGAPGVARNTETMSWA
jgi:beta-aspartyl-peptidase (threonine type)